MLAGLRRIQVMILANLHAVAFAPGIEALVAAGYERKQTETDLRKPA